MNMPNWELIGIRKMDKSEIWDQISPWLHSSWISSIATFALLLLFILFPPIKDYLSIGDDSLFYLPFIGAGAPFKGTPLTFVVFASLFYLVIGVGGSKGSLLTRLGWRSVLSNIFLNLAIAIFLFVTPLLSIIWALAIKDWEIAIGTWSVSEGNHGPWYRGFYHLRKLLYYTFLIPFGSFHFALLSFIIKPKKLSSIVLVGSILLWLSLICTHYWLVD
ncbi:MAG: hypothetical protein AB1502_11810 [Thermodesulfobacteriota bacterium]